MNNHRFVNHALDLKPASGLTKPNKDHRMTESETEAETIDRLAVALRKIAAANAARTGAARAPQRPAAPELDTDALKQSLDLLIARLRAGLIPTNHAITHVITE